MKRSLAAGNTLMKSITTVSSETNPIASICSLVIDDFLTGG